MYTYTHIWRFISSAIHEGHGHASGRLGFGQAAQGSRRGGAGQAI